MINFIHNIGDYFASNYFDENFTNKVIEKSGFSAEAIKEIDKSIQKLKPEYFKLKQRFIENHLRVKDKINLTHNFHTTVLEALGYDAKNTDYDQLFHLTETSVLPIRHILYRGDQPHVMIMEMHALIKTGEEEPDGLFEQRYNVENEDDERTANQQKYHRSQWADIFTVPEGLSISPMVINKAISELFLLPEHRRPKYVLLCAGNQYFLLEAEKWFRGSYLQLDLEMLFDDAAISKDYYAIFHLLLGKKLLAPTSEMILMDQLEEDSHKAAYEVTKDLKEGVIHAVENLANEAVFYLHQHDKIDYKDIDANHLKDDCLNMVYRLLFLFYAESRNDLDILPSNDEVYTHGYSLEMLRDLEQVPLNTESSMNGYFFHHSLFQLFQLLNKGYHEKQGLDKSFKVRHLDSPMFDPNNLHYLNKVQIRNKVWQDVICQLSLSKKQNKKARGRISYANLGINQLGSVYESLLAFRGFLAESDYIEVHRKRKAKETSEKVAATDGSYLVPRTRIGDFDPAEIFKTELANGEEEIKIIKEGTFIYRLSGRDRQKSASYYTPEVLTQTTVKYTLKPILERLEKGEIKALDLLSLKILEPAMGAAAFHNEVINQLAHAYLTYRQIELKQQVDPNKYQEELQKIKAYIALNNVYGVDLNPTAVELGKLSLWLNVIHKDMQTPFFGYRLGVGNAVVGAWLKVFKHKDFSFEPKGKGAVKKEWWNSAPTHLKFNAQKIKRKPEEIYHFLLPDNGMVASAGIKLLKEAYPAEAKKVTEWRKDFCKPIVGDEFALLQKIATAIDQLIDQHYKIQRDIAIVTSSKGGFFGDTDSLELDFQDYSYEQKLKFTQERLKTNAPYYKLKQIMDYWCSLWFWDVRDAKDLPTRTEWYNDLVQILNINLQEVYYEETEDGVIAQRDYKKDKKVIEKQLAEVLKQSSTSLFTNERALLVQRYANQYKFFHYELEFIEVFAERNGFDVAVGNPPWLKVTFEESTLLSEKYPEIEIRNLSAPQVKKLLPEYLKYKNLEEKYFEDLLETEVSGVFMNGYQNYPLLKGQQTDLYKCVLENGLHWVNENGFLGLIHPESIYDDPKGKPLRKEIYKRLKYHFHFQNALKVFAEIGHRREYGIHIYSGKSTSIGFYNIFNIYHPSMIDGCFIDNSTIEAVQGKKYKDANEKFIWNVKSHPKRKIFINAEILKILAKVLEDSTDWESAKLANMHSSDIINVLQKLKLADVLENREYKLSVCWDETNDINNGNIKEDCKYGDVDNFEFVYSSPHLYVATSYYKTPKVICKEKADYNVIDLNTISEDYMPRTKYVPLNIDGVYKDKFPIVGYKSWLEYFKLGFRKQQNLHGERTLLGGILLPNATHTNGVLSLTFENYEDLIEFSALSSSLIYDFFTRSIASANLTDSRLKSYPIGVDNKYRTELFVRILRLNCLNRKFEDLWKLMYQNNFTDVKWCFDDERLNSYNNLSEEWTYKTPLRNFYERRLALLEIDVIVAQSLKLSLDELIAVYNIEFPVLQQNEDDTWYDAKGNIVFTCNKGLFGVGLDRKEWESIRDLPLGETYEHTITKSELYQGEKVTYYAPFTKCDRVEDYKRAWAHFEERFNENK